MNRGRTLTMFFFFIIFSFLSSIPVVIPQCRPPHDCSVHVFRVRLSQKPDNEEPENTTYSAVKNSEYGTNYYEIRGGDEMTPKLAAEIIQSMGRDADQRLKDKINAKQFFWKAVDGSDHNLSATMSSQVNRKTTSTPSNNTFELNEFPVLLVTLLLCVGILLGILLTAFYLFMADMRKEPQFDRSSAVVYSKKTQHSVEIRPMLQTDEKLRYEKTESSSVAPSMSSTGNTRLGPSWQSGKTYIVPHSTTSRHVSL